MGMTVTEKPISVLEYAQEIRIDAPRAKVFDVITARVGEWFTPRFVAGTKVIAEPWVGGRVYEDNGDGAGVLWDICTAYLPPDYVAYESPWGFADGSATIVVDYKLSDDGAGTLVKARHKIIGFISDEARASYEAHIVAPEMNLETLLTAFIASLD